jgi:hypothetical protein
MAQEPEPDERERDDFERDRVAVDFDREEAGFRVDDDFAVVERDDDDFVVRERDVFARARVVAGFAEVPVARDAVVDCAGVVGREAGRSRLATRRASDSTSLRSLPSSSNTPCCSSDSRTRVTARATSSTIWLPRSFDPSGSARSTALRTASTVSAAPEPFLSFFFFASFLAMARV